MQQLNQIHEFTKPAKSIQQRPFVQPLLALSPYSVAFLAALPRVVLASMVAFEQGAERLVEQQSEAAQRCMRVGLSPGAMGSGAAQLRIPRTPPMVHLTPVERSAFLINFAQSGPLIFSAGVVFE